MTADRSSTSEKAGFEIIVDMSRAATAIGQLISNTGEFLKPLSPSLVDRVCPANRDAFDDEKDTSSPSPQRSDQGGT